MATYESNRYAISGANVTNINSANIADGSVTNAEFQTVDTSTSINTSLGEKLSAAGGTITSNGISFIDDIKAKFGTGNDTEIYFDDTNTKIKHTPAGGTLMIEGDSVAINKGDSSATLAQFTAGGEASLWHNNTKRIATDGSGITVTGTVAATAVTGDGSGLTDLNASNLTTGTVANARGGHNYTLSTSDPSGGVSGDVWYKY